MPLPSPSLRSPSSSSDPYHGLLHLALRRHLTGPPPPPLPTFLPLLKPQVRHPPPTLRCRCLPDQRDLWAGKGASFEGPKSVDVATLGNLCVDIVLSLPKLPPKDKAERKTFMEHLAASPPDKKYWEAGGNCNLAIAAARIGLHCVALGHVGGEIYGHFLRDVLKDEHIGMVSINEATENSPLRSTEYETLLCWVLVDPFQNHGFCSVADFSNEPAFSWMTSLSKSAVMAIEQSKILFCNGYAFDELYPAVIISALECAIDSGTAVFFDPGPRIRTLSIGDPDEQRALALFLQLSDVLLFTAEEVETLTGIQSPIQAGRELINKSGSRTKWVIIKMGPKGSILVTRSSVSAAPSFKVDVLDTVGCGDSFTAAIAFGFLYNLPSVNTLTLANAVGAATATGCGAGRNVAKLDKVLELLDLSDLNEDDKTWIALLEEECLDNEEATLLSSFVVNGSDKLTRVSPAKVISEIVAKLDGFRRSDLFKANHSLTKNDVTMPI